MTKYVYELPIVRPAELLAQVVQMGFQLDLVKAVTEGGFKEIELIGELRSMSAEDFALAYQSHKCVLDREGECPVCIVHYQRQEKTVSVMPSGVEEVPADSVVKAVTCPECKALVKVHQVSGKRYCVRCDWVGAGCDHVPENFTESMGIHGVETFTRCAKCHAPFVNGRYC